MAKYSATHIHGYCCLGMSGWISGSAGSTHLSILRHSFLASNVVRVMMFPNALRAKLLIINASRRKDVGNVNE